MARQRKTIAFNLSLLDRSKGGSALRMGLPSVGLSGMMDVSDINASNMKGMGSSHAGAKLKRNGRSGSGLGLSHYAYGLASADPTQEDELTKALRTNTVGLLKDTPKSIFKDPSEEEQYYQNAIQRFKDAATASGILVDEAAISSGLFHSGARVGAYGDIGERLQKQKDTAALDLATQERTFRESAIQGRMGLASNIQSRLAGQGIAARAQGLSEEREYGGKQVPGAPLLAGVFSKVEGATFRPAARPGDAVITLPDGTVVDALADGRMVDPKSAQVIGIYNPETQEIQFNNQETAGKYKAPSYWKPSLAGLGQASDIGYRAGLATGNIPLVNPDGSPMIDPDTGKQMTGTSLDAQKLSVQKEELYGGKYEMDPDTKKIAWKPTLAGMDQGLRGEELYGGKWVEDPTDPHKEIWQDSVEGKRLGLQSEEQYGGKYVMNKNTGKPEWNYTLAGQNSALDRAIAQGKSTGTFVDPVTGVSQETLEARIDALNRGERVEALYGGAKPVIFTSNELKSALGTTNGDAKYRPEFDANGDGVIDFDDLFLVTGGAENLGNDRFQFRPGPETLAGKATSADIVAKKRDQDLEDEKTYGGKWVADSTAAGGRLWKPTFDAAKWSDAQKFEYKKLAEDTRRAHSNERLEIGKALGFMDEPGKFSKTDFAIAASQSQAGLPFDPTFDFNSDGKVDTVDMFFVSQNDLISKGVFSTVEAKAAQAKIEQGATALGIEKSKLNEQVREFDKNMTLTNKKFMAEASGFIYGDDGQPIKKKSGYNATFTAADWSSIGAPAFGANKKLDLNLDGTITWDDYFLAAETAFELVPGSGTYSFTAYEMVDMPTQDRDEFLTSTAQWEKSFDQSADEFLKKFGLSVEELKNEKDANKRNAWLGVLAAALQAAGQLGAAAMGRGRTNKNPATAGLGGPWGGGGNTTAVDIGKYFGF